MRLRLIGIGETPAIREQRSSLLSNARSIAVHPDSLQVRHGLYQSYDDMPFVVGFGNQYDRSNKTSMTQAKPVSVMIC